MSETADITRRIELERADAIRQAVNACIKALEDHHIKAEPYRRAFKRAIQLLKDVKARELTP